ncbi:MAG: hypothetical protein V1661_03230 [bacterium]
MKAKCCPGCKLLASLEKNFCYLCGDKLPVPKGFEQLQCGCCGCGLLDDHLFCPNCGLSRVESLNSRISTPIDTSGNALSKINLKIDALRGGKKK